jgi:predicted chitinase
MSFLINAATYYASEPHQEAAWKALEAKLPNYLLEEFMAAYRASPEPLLSSITFTRQTFEDLTGYSKDLFTDQEVKDCNQMLKETGFGEDPELASMLIANILHETSNMKFMKELADGWAYEGRSDLGNVQPGDGPRFKGAGVLQLTGRYNYSRLSKALADPQVMKGVDYVASTYPFRSAVPWISDNRLLEVAKTEGFDAVCRRINGGWNGYEDRKTKYKICRDLFC